MKIIHCADFHFGRPFSCFDSEKTAAVRREEQFSALRKIADMAKNCDALLISGDLFDNPKPETAMIEKVTGILKTVPRVLIVPGNHDPKELYEKISLPENVYVFTGKTEACDCGDFVVYGNSGCGIGEVTLDSNKINILCIHADVNGNGDYNSITENELSSYGFDYVALGHIHKYSGVKKIGKTTFAYCGAPIAGGFDETGEKGVIRAEFSNETVKTEFITIDERAFYEITVVLDNAEGYGDIEIPQHSEKDFYKIVLKGTVSPDFVLRADAFRDLISDKFYYVKVKNEARRHISYEKLAEEYSLKGIFVRKMLERIKKDPENPELVKALETGVLILEGKKAEAVL